MKVPYMWKKETVRVSFLGLFRSYGARRMAFKHRFATALILFLALCGAMSPARADTFIIVGFGDSLMAGYSLGPGQGFTDRLQAALKAKGLDVTVANAGVSGDTSSGGLARLDWSVPDGTRLVILELGANDMLRGLSPEIAEKNLDAMLGKLKQRNIPVLLAGMRAAPTLSPSESSISARGKRFVVHKVSPAESVALRTHDGPPLSAIAFSTAGRMRSTIRSTPLELGCSPSPNCRSGWPATPSRKNG